MQATVPRLRPLGIGDLFDTIFRLYRNNFLVFIGIAALIQIPMILIQMALEVALGRQSTADLMQIINELPFFNPQTDSVTVLPIANPLLYYGLSFVLALLQIIVVQQLLNGAMANAIARRYLGQPVSVLEAYNFGARRLSALLIVGVLVAILTIVVAVVLGGIYVGGLFLMVSVAATQSGAMAAVAAILALLLMLLLLIVAVIVFAMIALRFLFVTQAVVLEDHGPLGALRRSWQLIRGSFWRVLGIVVLLMILVQIVVWIPMMIMTMVLSFTFGNAADPLQNYLLRQSITVLTSYAAQILVLPVYLSAYTLLYYDLRVRREGYDLQLRAAHVANLNTGEQALTGMGE